MAPVCGYRYASIIIGFGACNVRQLNLQLKHPLDKNVLFANATERGWLKVAALPRRRDEEAFAVIPVRPEEVNWMKLRVSGNGVVTINRFALWISPIMHTWR